MISNERMQKQYIDITDDITLRTIAWVKVVRVTIEDRLQFIEYVSTLCSRAPKLLNALSRIFRHISFKTEIHNL